MRLITGFSVAAAAAMLLTACGSPPAASDGGHPGQDSGIPRNSEVAEHLRPLADAVVAYSQTDTSGGNTASTLQTVKVNLAAVEAAERDWRAYADRLQLEGSSAGLGEAIAAFNAGLDTWQAKQGAGVANWEACLAKYTNDVDVATCMLAGYSVDDESAALAAYTVPLKRLLAELDIETESS